MPDESSTPPADTQAPPSEPVSAPEPVSEAPAEPPPQEAAPAPEPNTPTTPSVGTDTPPQAGGEETPAPAEVSESAPEPVSESATSTPAPEPTPKPQQTSQPQTTTTVIRPRGDLAAANAKIQATKQKRLDKIMSRLSEKGKITNDEVEKLLRVSDATATRYLDALEKEGRVRQEGKTGRSVVYVKI